MRRISCVLILIFGNAMAMQPPPPAFPAQQRPRGDAALVARGSSIYAIQCRSCHGQDLRGGDLGGPNLLRSQLVLKDQAGEAIIPVVQNGRSTPGAAPMPALSLIVDDIRAVAEYIHSVLATAQPQGAPPVSAAAALNLLVGDAKSGRRYFDIHCVACHSTTGDLAGIGTELPSTEQLQNSWVSGNRAGMRINAATQVKRPRVTVSLDNGEQASGTLQKLDDFIVSLITDSGQYRSFTRHSAAARVMDVVVDDPLLQHRRLWSQLTDRSVHDVTAYLASLK
jgi:cytochrome c oxidase cbb3-type subunit 3